VNETICVTNRIHKVNQPLLVFVDPLDEDNKWMWPALVGQICSSFSGFAHCIFPLGRSKGPNGRLHAGAQAKASSCKVS
jgi:hypothetical protein